MNDSVKCYNNSEVNLTYQTVLLLPSKGIGRDGESAFRDVDTIVACRFITEHVLMSACATRRSKDTFAAAVVRPLCDREQTSIETAECTRLPMRTLQNTLGKDTKNQYNEQTTWQIVRTLLCIPYVPGHA